MIRNLIFDFGKVLVDYDFARVIRTFFNNEEDFEQFTQLVANQEFINKCDKEDVPFAELIRQQQELFPQWARPLQLFHDSYVDYVIGEMPGMRNLLTRYKAQGYKLYGLTNWCSVVHVVMQQYHEIFGLLDGQVISSEEHLLKPDVAIYNCLLQRFGLNPQECVFADDRAENVAGAQKAGLHAIVFHDAQQYEAELKAIIEKEL